MMRRSAGMLVAVTAGLLLTVVPTQASDPVGIYCIVTNVVLAPNDQQPTTAQVWGACSEANGAKEGDDGKWIPGWYAPPKKGYLYYKTPAGMGEAIARREWNDIKKMAGTGEVVGWASRSQNVGRMRLATEQPRDPDTYPIHNGVAKISSQYVSLSSYDGLILALKKAAGTK